MVDERAAVSPMQAYAEHLRAGHLAYQFSPLVGRPVFPPRLVCPFTGTGPLEWRRSAGAGTVHAVTRVHARGGTRLVVLVDLDEGYRMLSEVEGQDHVAIGDRVQARLQDGADGVPYPVFGPVAG